MFKLFPLIFVLALTTTACSTDTGTAGAPSAAKADDSQSAALRLAQANAANAPQAVTDAVRKLAPHATIQSIVQTPIPGLYQVIASGQVVYVSADGRYMLQGNAYDLKTHTDLSDAQMDRLRREALATVSPAQMLRFAPPHPKYTVTVFTDIDCPYCREFHRHIADYNAAGIAVDYLFWPRSGLDTPSYDKAVSVWCAADRKRAFTAAKAGVDPKPATCANPVRHDFELGLDLGVDGTPSIIAGNGALIGGYATPRDLLQRLQTVHAPASGG
ncbi:MAG: DsbC family protein [Rhodanobacteraceae bacterium]